MAAWRECLLGDVVNLKRGYDLPHSARAAGPFPVVSSSGITDYHAEAKAKAPGVVTGRYGTLGQVFFIEKDYWPLNTSLYVQDFKGNDPRFISYFLGTLSFGSQNAAGAVPGVNRNHLHAIRVRVPPLPIQRRVAGILSAYDELIENSQRRIKILESMVRALYREWFVHFRFPGHESVTRVPSTLGEIPKGWEGTIGDIVTIDRDGINPFDFPNEEFEHYSIPAYDDGRTPAVEAGETIRSNKYCIDKACVLLSKLNPRIPRVWLPSPTGTRRAITSTEFLVLKPKAGFSRAFIYAKLCSDEFAGHFAGLAIGTSTSHQRVRPENVLAMPSTVPIRTIVEQFTNHVAPMLAASEQLRSKVQNLRRTRDLLLPRLLSGQIDVEALDHA